MNWLFILIRTFPFWAAPIGISMVATGLRARQKKKWAFLGILLLVGAAAFLFFQGHFKAVPFTHELLHDAR